MIRKLVAALLLLISISAKSQSIDLNSLTTNNGYGSAFKKLYASGNFVFPFGGDTTSKQPAQLKLLGNKLYFTGSDGWWREAANGGGGTTYSAGVGMKLVSNVFLTDTFYIVTKQSRDKLKDSIGAVLSDHASDISTLYTLNSSKLGKADSTLYLTKAWYKKGADSMGVIVANHSSSITANSLAIANNSADIATNTSNISVKLSKSDSTLYSTKANYKKGADSLGALIPTNTSQLSNGAGFITSSSLSPYVQKSDSTLYSTKANASKSRDSVVALIPTNTSQLSNGAGFITSSSLTPYFQRSDSTLYSTKANYKKGADSLGSLIATNTTNIATNTSNIVTITSNIATKKTATDSGYIAGPQAYAPVALLKKGLDSMAIIATTANNWGLTGNSVSAGTQFLGSTNNVSLRFRTNNTQQMMLDSTGKLFIGTTAPIGSELLTLQKNQNAGTALFIANTTAGTGSSATLCTYSSSINYSGLDNFSSSTTSSNSVIQSSARLYSYNSLVLATISNNPIYFYIGNQQRWRIDLNGSLTNNTANANTASVFDLVSTTKGALLPRMTKTQRDAISSPPQGLLVFVTDNGGYLTWYNSGWFKVSSVSD